MRSPAVTAALAINYDDGSLFSTISAKYVGSQYSTFMNDQKMPAYATADFTVGYRFPKVGLKGRPELRLNIINLTNANYLSGIASPGTNLNGTYAKYGTFVPGNAPTYFIGGGIAGIVTLRQAF